AGLPGPCARCGCSAGGAGAPIERIRIGAARLGPDRSDQGLIASTCWPLDDSLFSLLGAKGQLREAVHRAVLAEEVVQHHAEQEHAAAGELVLVEGEGNAHAPHEVRPRMADTRNYRLAVDGLDAVDLFADGRDVAVVVKRQQLQ